MKTKRIVDPIELLVQARLKTGLLQHIETASRHRQVRPEFVVHILRWMDITDGRFLRRWVGTDFDEVAWRIPVCSLL